MRPSPLSLLAGALAVNVAAFVTSNVDESFQGSDYYNDDPSTNNCRPYLNCSTKSLPLPGDGLQWNNLHGYTGPPDTGIVGLVPIDWIIARDWYYARWNDTSQAATVTKKYPGSCVRAWQLNQFDFGCSTVQNASFGDHGFIVENMNATCSLTVEALNQQDQPVAHETFTSIPRQDATSGVYRYPMTRLTPKAGGLKGKKFASLKFTGKYVSGPGTFVSDLVLGIDEVKYTLYNFTNCH